MDRRNTMQEMATSRNSTKIRACSSVNFRKERRDIGGKEKKKKKEKGIFILFLGFLRIGNLNL